MTSTARFLARVSVLIAVTSGHDTRAHAQDPFAPFVTEMMAHARSFAPTQCAVISDDRLREILNDTVRRASAYGFTLRGPIRTFIELTFIFGSEFDSDAQYPWARQILRSDAPEMTRAERLFKGTIDYQKKVSVSAARKALVRWVLASRSQSATSKESTVSALRQEATQLFPEKAAYVGANGLTQLITEAVTEARRLALPSPEGEALMTALFFALGHGCTRDPLYPTIADALRRAETDSPMARFVRLREAARMLAAQELKDAWPF